MAREFKVGDIVRHFKGNEYRIEDFAEHTETGERMVIYRALYGSPKLWCRPYDMFMEKVNREKYPDAMQEFRFEPAFQEPPCKDGEEFSQKFAAVEFDQIFDDGTPPKELAAIYDASKFTDQDIMDMLDRGEQDDHFIVMTKAQFYAMFDWMYEHSEPAHSSEEGK